MRKQVLREGAHPSYQLPGRGVLPQLWGTTLGTGLQESLGWPPLQDQTWGRGVGLCSQVEPVTRTKAEGDPLSFTKTQTHQHTPPQWPPPFHMVLGTEVCSKNICPWEGALLWRV